VLEKQVCAGGFDLNPTTDHVPLMLFIFWLWA